MASSRKVLLGVEVEKGTVNKAIKDISPLDDSIAGIAQQNEAVAKSATIAGRALKEAYGDKAAKSINDVTVLQSKLAKETAHVRAEQEKLNDSYDEARTAQQRRVDVYGDIDTSLKTFGGAASAVGATQIGGAASLVGEIAGVTEQLPLFATGVQQVGKNLTNMPGILGGLATAGAAAAGGLGLTAAGLGAILAVALPIVAIAGAAAFAIGKLNSSLAAQAKEMRLASEASRQLALDVAGGLTTQDAQERKAVLERTLQVERDTLAEREAAYTDFLDHQARNAGAFGNAYKGILRVVDTREDTLNSLRNESRNAVQELEAELTALNNELEDGAALTANDRAKALKEQELELAQARLDAANAIAQLNARESQLLTGAAQQQADLLEDRAIRDRRANEDYEREQETANKRLVDIRAKGLDAVAKLEKDASKSLSDAAVKAGENINKVRGDAFDKELKANADFTKESGKIAADFKKQRIREQEDLADSLFQSQIDNDIISIILARRAAEKKAARDEQDFNEEKTAREQERGETVLAIRQDAAARIEEIKAGLQQERQQIAANLAERLADQQANLAEQLASEQAAQDEQEAARQLRLSRQQEDDDLADSRRERNLQQQLDDIDRQRQAQEQSINAVENTQIVATQNMVATIQAGATQIQSALQQAFTPSGNRSLLDRVRDPVGGYALNAARRANPSGQGNAASGKVRLFSDGGIVPAGKPVAAQFEGERSYAEAVLPLDRRALERVLPGGFGGGTQYQISMGNIGSNISRAEVREAIITAVKSINFGNAQAINGT